MGKLTYDIIVILYGWKANCPKSLTSNINILLTKDSFIKVDNFCTTNIDNIYAIGNITNRSHPCVATAMSDGTIAAKDICNKLEKIHNT